jgi:hypothetical protein
LLRPRAGGEVARLGTIKVNRSRRARGSCSPSPRDHRADEVDTRFDLRSASFRPSQLAARRGLDADGFRIWRRHLTVMSTASVHRPVRERRHARERIGDGAIELDRAPASTKTSSSDQSRLSVELTGMWPLLMPSRRRWPAYRVFTTPSLGSCFGLRRGVTSGMSSPVCRFRPAVIGVDGSVISPATAAGQRVGECSPGSPQLAFAEHEPSYSC